MVYKIRFYENQLSNLPEWVDTENPQELSGGILQVEGAYTEAQASELACLKVDGEILDIVPPEGEPDPKCDRKS